MIHERKGKFVQEESYREIARERTPSIAQALEKVRKRSVIVLIGVCKYNQRTFSVSLFVPKIKKLKVSNYFL